MLAILLLVTIFAEPLLTLVGSNFMTLALTTAWHNNVLSYEKGEY